jgi:hypothetical protein
MILLWFLSENPTFLKSKIGRRLFVTRCFADINRTAIASDGTDSANFEQAANEVLSKSVYGRAFPKLDKLGLPMWIAEPNYIDEYKTQNHEYSTVPFEPKPNDTTSVYYDLLNTLYGNDEPTRKKFAFSFTHQDQPGSEYASLVPYYVDAMKQGGFSKPFEVFFDTIGLEQEIIFSFHTFGADYEMVRTLLEGKGKRCSFFVVSVVAEFKSAYTLTHVGKDGKFTYAAQSMSAAEFFQHTLDNPDTVCIVLENYTRWKENDKCAKAGKVGVLYPSWFTMVRGIVFDDNKCWKCSGPTFVHVNPFRAATDKNYFRQIFKPSSFLMCRAFWTNSLLLGLWMALLVSGNLFFWVVWTVTMIPCLP